MAKEKEPVKEGLKALKKNKVVSAVLVTFIGLLLVIWPGTALILICRIIGVCALIGGAVGVIMFFTTNIRTPGIIGGLTGGLLLLIVGIWILIRPDILASVLPMVLGFLIIVSGMINLADCVTIKRQDGSVVASLIMAVITIILGIVIITHAFGTSKLFFRLLGIVMMYDGISDLVIIGHISDKARGFEKAVKDSEPIDTDATIEDDK